MTNQYNTADGRQGGRLCRLLSLKGFTLIELLVVIAIIGLLMSITVPTLTAARRAGKRAKCMSNLRSIGQGLRSYMDDHGDYYPPMSDLPTMESVLYPDKPRLAMSDPRLLGRYVGNQIDVFCCPSDRIINASGGDPPPPGVNTWFEWQGSSYEPRSDLTLPDGGRWIVSRENFNVMLNLPGNPYETWEDYVGSLSNIELMHDYEAFHGDPSRPNSRLALYADFHVEGYKGSD